MTIETKITKSGSLTLKYNGKRSNYREVAHILYLYTNIGTTIKNADGKIFTCTNVKVDAPSYKSARALGYEYTDETGKRYFFGTGEEAINRIARNHFDERNFFDKEEKIISEPDVEDYAISTEALDVVVSERDALIAEFKADGYKFVITTKKVFFGENNSTSLMPTTTYVKTYEKALHELKLDAEFYAQNPAHDGGFSLATIDGELIAKGDKIAEYKKNLKANDTESKAKFLKDKNARESKALDDTFSANVMPLEVDDTDDKLIDEPIAVREERIGDDIITYRGDECVRVQSLKYGAIITKCSKLGEMVPGSDEEIIYRKFAAKDMKRHPNLLV